MIAAKLGPVDRNLLDRKKERLPQGDEFPRAVRQQAKPMQLSSLSLFIRSESAPRAVHGIAEVTARGARPVGRWIELASVRSKSRTR